MQKPFQFFFFQHIFDFNSSKINKSFFKKLYICEQIRHLQRRVVQCAPLDTIVRAQVMEIWIFGFPIFSLCCELIDIGDKWHNPEKKISCSHLILKVKTCYFQTKCMVKRMKWIIWQLVQSRKFLHNCYVKEKSLKEIPGRFKGQLISKCLIGGINSPKKRTKTILYEVP